EVTLRAGERHCRIVADDLRTHLAYRLAHHRVDLPRHDAGARLQVGDLHLAQASSRTGAHPPDVVSDLVKRDGDDPQLAARLHEGVASTLRLEVVARLGERQAGLLPEKRDDAGGEAGGRVDAGSNRRPAE